MDCDADGDVGGHMKCVARRILVFVVGITGLKVPKGSSRAGAGTLADYLRDRVLLGEVGPHGPCPFFMERRMSKNC